MLSSKRTTHPPISVTNSTTACMLHVLTRELFSEAYNSLNLSRIVGGCFESVVHKSNQKTETTESKARTASLKLTVELTADFADEIKSYCLFIGYS